MKKLSNIDESVWSDIHKRSNGETVRKEDEFNPEYIDLSENSTVYWAKDSLEINGENKFYFDDVENYNNNGWRLPTLKEVEQIIDIFKYMNKSWYRDDDDLGYEYIKLNGKKLRIKTEDALYGFGMWTKNRSKEWPILAYSYGYDNMSKFAVELYNSHQSKFYVFLVKDKK